MMNYIVPDFETDEDYSTPELPNKSTMGGNEDIMELLWHNGQVVMQSQNQRSVGNKKPETKPSVAPPTREIRSSAVEDATVGPSDMFMQEDEMASWLHYPNEDNSLESYLYSNDLLYPTPPSSAPITTAPTALPPPPPPSVLIPSRPPVPPYRRAEVDSGQQKCSNFLHFSRPSKGRSPESGPTSSGQVTPASRPSTVVASNETPAAAPAPESRASHVSDIPATVSAGNVGGGGSTSGIGAARTSSAGREIETCDMSVTSSPGTGGSGASASMELPSTQNPPAPADDRKRKGRDTDDADECHSEDVEIEYPDAKKQSHGGSTSTKRSRAAEVHNLSERRRRDRINEKMKALQELIPRCNKSDKASMLDEAIEYLKSLQMQVQMMSMGCSMVPMMFPGVQQYVPPMAMGMGMGMGMGMDMGMNRPMVPYPAILPGSSLPNPAAAAAAAAHLGQRFPVPGFNMSPVTVPNPAASQPANLSAPMINSLPLNSQNQPRVPNFADPFQQHLGLHQTQLPLAQNQGGMPPIPTKPSSSKDATNPDHHQTA